MVQLPGDMIKRRAMVAVTLMRVGLNIYPSVKLTPSLDSRTLSQVLLTFQVPGNLDSHRLRASL